MDFSQYLRIVRKWWWLVVLAAFVAGAISFVANTGRPPVYRAETILSIGYVLDSPNPDLSAFRTQIELATNYVQILRTYEVLENTVNALGLSIPPEALRSAFRARLVEGTSLLTISVDSVDPVQAADIANELAVQLINKTPGLSAGEQERLNFAEGQVSALTQELEGARAQLALLDAQLGQSSSIAETENLNAQRQALITQISQTTSSIAAFTNQIIQLQQRTNKLEIIERARIPTSADSVNIFNLTLVGAAVGAAIAAGLAFAVEYLDDTIRTSDEAVQVMALPVMGAIARIGKRTDGYRERIVTNFPSLSPIAESYRTLRTNLLFSGSGERGVYVVTSANPEEGKSITTANLAITMALAGLQVLLIDADLRRPKQHEIFELENNVGLTTLLFADPERSEAIQAEIQASGEMALPANLQQCLQSTAIPRLRVISSGFIPSNPTEILGSALMQRWIEAFRASTNIDIVLIDTPPSLMVADSAVLAATTNADVLLVIDSGKTRRAAAKRAKERFSQLGVEVKGLILNRVNPRDDTYDYSYSYSYYYTPTQLRRDNKRRFNGKDKAASDQGQPA